MGQEQRLITARGGVPEPGVERPAAVVGVRPGHQCREQYVRDRDPRRNGALRGYSGRSAWLPTSTTTFHVPSDWRRQIVT